MRVTTGPTSVLFDLDGTLTDPFEGITNCVVHALGALGVDAPDATSLRWVIGPPLLGSFERLVGDPDRAVEALRLYRERFSTVGLYENQLYPFVPEMLEGLRAKGHRLVVATSKPTVYTTRILEHFELTPHFDSVYGSELDGTRTDKADLIAHILESESLDARRTVMVGDRRHDVVGARANGMPGIGVLYGYGTREELESAGAVSIAETPADVGRAVSVVAGA